MTVAKPLGTTPHGLRHLYGGLLKELGMSITDIQECMHHLSPFSSLTYTSPRNEHINKVLDEAAERAKRGELNRLNADFKGAAEALEAVLHRTSGGFA